MKKLSRPFLQSKNIAMTSDEFFSGTYLGKWFLQYNLNVGTTRVLGARRPLVLDDEKSERNHDDFFPAIVAQLPAG
jgi:hypothetical protein